VLSVVAKSVSSWFFLSSPLDSIPTLRGSGRGEEPSGEKILRLIQIRVVIASLEEILPAGQAKSMQAEIADSSSRKAVPFLSAGTTKRFPLSRCASVIQIVCSLRITAETQPHAPTGFPQIVANDRFLPEHCPVQATP